MQKGLLLFLIFVTINIYADSWKHFGRSNPSPEAYELKKGVAYMEMRLYEVDKSYHKVVKKGYKVIWRAYRKPLNRFDKQLVRKFKSAAPNLSAGTDLVKYSTAYSLDGSDKHYFIANVFYIDSSGKIWRMNTKKDLLSYILPIDNSADLSEVLWLKSYYGLKKYRKVPEGYEVIDVESIDFETDKKKCGEYTYRILMDRNGHIKKKVLVKSKHTPCAVI